MILYTNTIDRFALGIPEILPIAEVDSLSWIRIPEANVLHISLPAEGGYWIEGEVAYLEELNASILNQFILGKNHPADTFAIRLKIDREAYYEDYLTVKNTIKRFYQQRYDELGLKLYGHPDKELPIRSRRQIRTVINVFFFEDDYLQMEEKEMVLGIRLR
ncbi:MAG: hypothetical protein AAFU67_16015 [Bacteroidota bacterium]